MSTFTSEPGIRLGGRYRLEDRLASAVGWSAWKAIDEILARPVSVITFEAGFPRLEQVVTAARAASRLTDTRLTQVFDVEDTWDHAYIVLEWPVGDTLGDLVAAGPMEPATGARIVAEAASALSGAHAAGLAHLCLRPDSVRWTTGGGVKVTGLGIDAALSGVTSEDPELADTRGLGRLLYSVLTGFWPDSDYPELPPAPESDGQPRRPRQVRAGVPAILDDLTERALAPPGQDNIEAFTALADLAAALSAVIPPVQVPPAAAQDDPRRDANHRSAQRGQLRTMAQRTLGQRAELPQTRPSYQAYQEAGRVGRRASVRTIAISALVLIAVAGATTAAFHFLHKPPSTVTQHRSGSPSASSSASATTITPQSALGFDALNPADTGDENSNQAPNVLNGNPAGWSTQWYGSPHFGNLKSGTGFILNLGSSARVGSVMVQFGTMPGANVELRVGDSGVPSKANLDSMTTVARASDVSGSYTFTIKHPASGQYLVIWFTKLPRLAGQPGKYEAKIFKVVVTGAS